MAGGQERILRRRIRSVQSTKKITRAMELIAASRIVRAQARVEAAVPYSDQITEVVHDLADAGGAVQSPLLVPRPGSGAAATSGPPPTRACAAPTTPPCGRPRGAGSER